MKLNLEILPDESVLSTDSAETVKKIIRQAEKFITKNKLGHCKVLGCNETSHPSGSVFEITFKGPITELLVIYGKYFYGKSPDSLSLDDLRDLVSKEMGQLEEAQEWYVDWKDNEGDSGTSGPFATKEELDKYIAASDARASASERTDFGEPYLKDKVAKPATKVEPKKEVAKVEPAKPTVLNVGSVVARLFRGIFGQMYDVKVMGKAEVMKLADSDDHARLFIRDLKGGDFKDCIVMSCNRDVLDIDDFEGKMQALLGYIAVKPEQFYFKSDVDGKGKDWVFLPIDYAN